jgi:hypothetical protein
MEMILFINAAISIVLLIVHLVDYFSERLSPLLASRGEPPRTDAPPSTAKPSLQEPAEQFDRAA